MGAKTLYRICPKFKGFYYDKHVEDDDCDDHDAPEDGTGDPTAQVHHQPKARSIRYEGGATKAQAAHPSEQPTFSDLFDGVLALWMRAARGGQRRPPATEIIFRRGYNQWKSLRK